MELILYFFIIFSIFNFIYSNEDKVSYKQISINPGKMFSKTISYDDIILLNPNKIKFVDNYYYYIHVFSINCEIEINILSDWSTEERKDVVVTKINNNSNTFLIKTESNEKVIEIKPLNNKLNNNKNEECSLVINTLSSDFNLEVKEENPTIFYFEDGLNQIDLLYSYNNIKDKTFIAFQFLFNEKENFEITITGLKTEQKRKISNSYNFFLTKDLFDNENDNIKINIIKKESKIPVLVTFRVISNEFNPLILQKNYLNYGFITSDNEYQYYYMKIFQGEEGEIMLHDKRSNGKLIGKICHEEKEKCLSQIKSFLNNDENNNNNMYRENIKKLSFSYQDTEQCENGCYLLISYYHEKLLKVKDIIGYEFTLLTRIWNKEDWHDTNIINIPFNEYIFGYFEKNRINHHYYSIFIPNEIDDIYLEWKGNFIQIFFGEGKRKLNTYNNMLNTTIKLELEERIDYIKLPMNNYTNKYLSFAIRPQNFFEDISSQYFLRIFQLKKDENLIMPLDSNIGNRCKCKDAYKNTGDVSLFSCFYLLKNDYNEFSQNFSVSFSNLNIYSQKLYYLSNKSTDLDLSYESINKRIKKVSNANSFFENFMDNNLSFILLQFKTNEEELILTTFYDEKKDIYPQIYSPQIFKIDNETKFYFSSIDDYSVTLKWINGTGTITGFLNKDLKQDKNNKDKLYSVALSDMESKNISFSNIDGLYIFIKLDYNIISNFKGEIQPYSKIEIINDKIFPIYYFKKFNSIYSSLNSTYTIDINYKIHNFNDYMENFTVEGMFCDQKTIEEKQTQNYIDFSADITSEYDISIKNGFLHINYTDIQNQISEFKNYIMIKINKLNNEKTDNKILVQIIAIEFLDNEGYIPIPYNQFIMGTLNSSNMKKYYLSNEIYKGGKIVLEFSRNYESIDLDLEKENDNNDNKGIEVYNIKNDEINITLTESISRNRNYIFKYYYKTENYSKSNYEFNGLYKIKDYKEIKKNIKKITFQFNNLITKNENSNNIENLIIYCNLFLKDDLNDENELLNTIAINSVKPIATKNSSSSIRDENFTVDFDFNTTNVVNFKYIMQIKFYVNTSFLSDEIIPYSVQMDLTKYLQKDKESNNKSSKSFNIILISIIGFLLIIVLIVLLMVYKMKIKNKELREKVLSISFSKGNSDNYLTNSNTSTSKRDEDYENTFI